MLAIVACKEDNFDEYAATFETNMANHVADLDTIANML